MAYIPGSSIHHPPPGPFMRSFSLVLLFLLASPVPAMGQRTDQKALEAAVRELAPPDDVSLTISPIMIAPAIRGNVSIDPENQKLLETRFGARIEEPGDAVECEDVTQPSTCRIDDGGVILQFFMPEPVQNGVLYLAVMVLRDGSGEGGQIGREWWNIALLQRPEVGGTVVGEDLTKTADGPW